MTEQAVGNAELEAFKVQVATVARELARQHNLCSVVDQALDQMGISTRKKEVEVVLGVSGRMTMEMDETVYSGLTEEQRVEWIKDRLHVSLYNSQLIVQVNAAEGAGASSGRNQLTFGKDDIQVVSVSDEITPPTQPEYLWRKGGTRGRVLHAIRADRYQAGNDVYAWVESACGRATFQSYDWRDVYGYGRCAPCEARVPNA